MLKSLGSRKEICQDGNDDNCDNDKLHDTSNKGNYKSQGFPKQIEIHHMGKDSDYRCNYQNHSQYHPYDNGRCLHSYSFPFLTKFIIR